MAEATTVFPVRLTMDDAAQVRAAAEARGVSVSVVIRQAVAEHLARREGDRAVPVIDAVFAKHVDRLAGLIAKTYVASATAAWQTRYLIERSGADSYLLMRRSVCRALVDLRRKGSAMGEAEIEEYAAAEAAAESDHK